MYTIYIDNRYEVSEVGDRGAQYSADTSRHKFQSLNTYYYSTQEECKVLWTLMCVNFLDCVILRSSYTGDRTGTWRTGIFNLRMPVLRFSISKDPHQADEPHEDSGALQRREAGRYPMWGDI